MTTAVMIDLGPTDVIASLDRSVAVIRQGSTDARQLGYEESWRGFQRSPLIGQGWPGEILSDAIPMPIGTHSSIYGVLYTGGVMTFVPFCLALISTVVALYRKSGSGGAKGRSALAIAVSLATVSYGEGIYSFILPTLFAFCWIGAGLRDELPNLERQQQLGR